MSAQVGKLFPMAAGSQIRQVALQARSWGSPSPT